MLRFWERHHRCLSTTALDEDLQVNYISNWYGNKLNEKYGDSAGAGVYPSPSGSQFFAKQSIL
jgi:hypothetical protein